MRAAFLALLLLCGCSVNVNLRILPADPPKLQTIRAAPADTTRAAKLHRAALADSILLYRGLTGD